jgi:hypothetical protein
MRSLFIHPPTALARLNILISALLQISGLDALRAYVLKVRQRKHASDR